MTNELSVSLNSHLVFAFGLGLCFLCRHLIPQFGFFSQTHLLSLQTPAVLRGRDRSPKTTQAQPN